MPICPVRRWAKISPLFLRFRTRFEARSVVPPPPRLGGENGILRVSFSYQTRTDVHGRQLFCFMTPSGMENPTLHIRPGGHLLITVTNNTSGGMDPMELYPSNCSDHFMNTAWVNIHCHGTNTSLACGQDRVIKTIVTPGQTFQYDVGYTSTEPPGNSLGIQW